MFKINMYIPLHYANLSECFGPLQITNQNKPKEHLVLICVDTVVTLCHLLMYNSFYNHFF